MSSLAQIPTKDLKSELNEKLAGLTYSDSTVDFNTVAPYIAELLKRGYVATTRISVVDDANKDNQVLHDMPTYAIYQTPFSNEVGFNPILNEKPSTTKSGKCLPDGTCTSEASRNRIPKWVIPRGENGNTKLPVFTLLSKDPDGRLKPKYGFFTFDSLYTVAKDPKLGKEITGDDGTLLEMKVLTDQEVADTFSIPLQDAKYLFVLGLRHQKSPSVLKTSLEDYGRLNKSKAPFDLLRHKISDLKEAQKSAVSKHFIDFVGKDPEVNFEWVYLENGVDVRGINKADFDKKYENPKTENTEVTDVPSDTRQLDKQKPKTSSNAIWWIVGGVVVSSAVYFAYSRRKSSY